MEFDPAVSSRDDAYRLLIGAIVPRPIAWVSSVGADGVRNLAPFSFFNAICPVPMLISFAPMRNDGNAKKDTLQNVEETGEFVVNIATEDTLEKMDESGTSYPPEVDEFAVTGLTPVPSRLVAPARIGESPIAFECRTHQVLHFEQGSLVIGRVVYAHIDDRVLRDGRIAPDLLRPVARMGGPLYARPELLPYRRTQ